MSEEWEEKFSEKHKRKFWKNKETGKTTWTPPAQITSAPSEKKDVNQASAEVEESEWEEKFSEKHKRKFWKNKKTGETTWKEPPKPQSSSSKPKDGSGINEDSNKVSAAIEWDWEEKFSEKHKRKFWKNKKTGETTWKEPPKPQASDTADKGGDGSATKENSDNTAVEWDWEEKFSEKHKRKFWKNKKTGETTWKEPPKPQASDTADKGGDGSATKENSDNTAVEWDWEEKFSEKHKRKFWKNKKTGETTWKEPPKPKASMKNEAIKEETPLEWEWEEKFSDKHKKKFWKNKKTGETTWKEPPKPQPSTTMKEEKHEDSNEAAAEWDWEEKFSEKHKKKFWKNKKTGQTSWKEPPKPHQPVTSSTKPVTEDQSSSGADEFEEVEDPSWKKLHSKEKQRDFWKNIETGKTTWHCPPKIKRKKAGSTSGNTSSDLSMQPNDDESVKETKQASSKVSETKLKDQSLSACSVVYMLDKMVWRKYHLKMLSGAAVLVLHSSGDDCDPMVESDIDSEVGGRNPVPIEQMGKTGDGSPSRIVLNLDAFESFCVVEGGSLLALFFKASNANSESEDKEQGMNKQSQQANIKSPAVEDSEKANVKTTTSLSTSKEAQDEKMVTLSFLTPESCNAWCQLLCSCCPHLRPVSSEEQCRMLLENMMTKFVISNHISLESDSKQTLQWLRDYSSTIMAMAQSEPLPALNAALRSADDVLKLSNNKCARSPLTWQNLPWKGLVAVAFNDESLGANEIAKEDTFQRNMASMWLVIEPNRRRLLFYDKGLSSKAAVVAIMMPHAQVHLESLEGVSAFQLTVAGCKCGGVCISIQFKFSTSVEYLQWAVLFEAAARGAQGALKSAELSTPLDSGNQSVVWSNGTLNFALDAISCLCDRHMTRNMLRTFQLSGRDFRTIELTSINQRIVVHRSGSSLIPEGSVAVALNEYTALGVTGKEFLNIAKDVPVQLPVAFTVCQFPRKSFRCFACFDSVPLEGAAWCGAPWNSSKQYESSDKSLSYGNILASKDIWNKNCEIVIDSGKVFLIETASGDSKKAKMTFDILHMSIRLRETGSDGNIATGMNLGIEIRDSDCYAFIGAESTGNILKLCSGLLSAMKILGAIEMDVEFLYAKCLHASKEKSDTELRNTPSAAQNDLYQENNINHANTDAALPTKAKADSGEMENSIRFQVIEAAHQLEDLLSSMGLPPNFPTVESIHKMLQSLEFQNKRNHESINELIRLEYRIVESQGIEDPSRVSEQISSSRTSADHPGSRPLAKDSSPMVLEELSLSPEEEGRAEKTKTAAVESTAREGADEENPSMIATSNSSVSKDSPVVFVPPADMSKDRRSLRNIVPSVRRQDQTGGQPSSQPRDQDLLGGDEAPLLAPGTKVAPEAESTATSCRPPPPPPPKEKSGESLTTEGKDAVTDDKKEETTSNVGSFESSSSNINSKNVSNDDNGGRDHNDNGINEKSAKEKKPAKESAAAERLSPRSKSEAEEDNQEDEEEEVVGVELSDSDKEACAALLFHLRSNPQCLLSMVPLCKNFSELSEFVKVVLHRVYCHWSVDPQLFERFLVAAIERHLPHREAPLLHTSRLLHVEAEAHVPTSSERVLLEVVFEEMCQQPDMLGFIFHLSEAVGTSGRRFLVQEGSSEDIAALCRRIIDPLALRFHELGVAGAVPRVFCAALRALRDAQPHCGDGLAVLLDCLIPRLVQWLYRDCTRAATSPSGLVVSLDAEEMLPLAEQSRMIETAQLLLKVCFISAFKPDSAGAQWQSTRVANSSISLSLNHHATIAHSKAIMSRFVDECLTKSSSSSRSSLPTRQLADLPPDACKPLVLARCFSCRLSELHLLLSTCRALSSTASDSPASRALFPQLVAATGDLMGRYSAKQWTKSSGEVVTLQQAVDFDGRLSGASSSLQECPGAREVASLQWLIAASRSSLRQFYQSPNALDVATSSLLKELSSLHRSISSKRQVIEGVVRDMQLFAKFEELISIYETEIALVTAMLQREVPDKEEKPSSCDERTDLRAGQSREELMSCLGKCCHQQFRCERDIVSLESDSVSTPEVQLKEKEARSKLPSASNPLQLVLRNVF